VLRVVAQIVGLALLLIGLAVMVLPVPFGFVLVFLGGWLIVSNNRLIARGVRALRRHWPAFDRIIRSMERVLPKHWREQDASDFSRFERKH
jgi:hypothetical protein